MPVSFKSDILPLFRPVDISHMKGFNVLLDDYPYMSDPAAAGSFTDHGHARNVYCYLTGDCQPRMPIGGPFWSAEQLRLFQQWMNDGYRP